jgi:hypothetical protein
LSANPVRGKRAAHNGDRERCKQYKRGGETARAQPFKE